MKWSLIKEVAFWTVWSLCLVFFLSGPAYAWGPATHIETSLYLIEHLALLAPVVRKLIKSFPKEFVYGSTVPDMVLGKRYMPLDWNNHTWNVGFHLLENARTDAERSFSYGYLSHLATDTVAHNIFIPDRILCQFDKRRRDHVMQELIFDAMIDDEVWKITRDAPRRPFPKCDELLETCMPKTPIPDKINRNIFHCGMYFIQIGVWERIIRRLRRNWKEEIAELSKTSYLDHIHRVGLEFLADPDNAPCLLQCPTGKDVLPEANKVKRELKRMSRLQDLGEEQYVGVLASFDHWRYMTLNPDSSRSGV